MGALSPRLDGGAALAERAPRPDDLFSGFPENSQKNYLSLETEVEKDTVRDFYTLEIRFSNHVTQNAQQRTRHSQRETPKVPLVILPAIHELLSPVLALPFENGGYLGFRPHNIADPFYCIIF